MTPRRDAFTQALLALRRRLLAGDDQPGERLPIIAIAEALGLSTTPVREALARLAGEGLVDKDGGDYRRPRLDATALAELYDLRKLYLAAAASPALLQAAVGRLSATESTVQDAKRSADRCADLLLAVIEASGDRALRSAYGRCANALSPFLRLEALVITALDEEFRAFERACALGDAEAFKRALRKQLRSRVAAAPAIVRLASGENIRRI